MNCNYWSSRTLEPVFQTREATALKSPCTATKEQPCLAATRDACAQRQRPSAAPPPKKHNFFFPGLKIYLHILKQNNLLTSFSVVCLAFVFNLFFLLKDDCSTEFCCFLSNLNVNQPQIYIYPLAFESPSHLLPHLPPLD